MEPGNPALDGTLGRPAMARTLGLFYVAGATLAVASLLLPRSPTADVWGLVVVTVVAYAAGGLLLVGAARLPRLAIPAFLAVGSLVITAAVYLDGHTNSVYAIYYVWVGVEAFSFLSRRFAALQMVLAGGAYAWALAMIQSDGLAGQRWLVTVGTATIAGLLVSYQRDRIGRLVHQLTGAARTDPLTGLLDKRGFEETLEQELERARRSGRPVTVVTGHLDGFELVDGRGGRRDGDEVLKMLALDISKWKRRVDVAARIGGPEFGLLLPETDERGAFLVAERLRRAVQRTFSERPLPLTISFGIARWPDHGEETQLLIRAAGQALYAAKDMGADRSVIYSPEVVGMLAAEGRSAERGEMQLATVLGLTEALDIRDTGSARHSQTVGSYALLIAEEIGLPPERAERVRVAGVLHDVGKVGISDKLLSKPGPLDPEEWDEMRMHPEIAGRLLSRPEFTDLCGWIVAHHERPDGSGYPEGLAGEDIPLEARILAVADAYEAMTADRVYRPALGEETARAELLAGSGTQFDPAVVQAFLTALDRRSESDDRLAAGATR